MRRRELAVGTVVAALLCAGVFFLGPDEDGRGNGGGKPSTPSARGKGEDERPAVQKPPDPRRPGEPAPAPATRRTAPIPPRGAGTPPVPPPEAVAATCAVRVVDAAGRPRAGVVVELRDADPALGRSRRFGAPATSDVGGLATLSWPSDAAVRRGFVAASLLLAAPRAVAVERDGAETATLALPDLGVVEASFVDEAGEPYGGAIDARLLVADRDPPVDDADRERAVARTLGGTARFEGVEANTLVVIEGDAADPDLRVAPLVADGPSENGATLRLTLRVLRRDAAPFGVSPRAPDLGPPPAGPTPAGRGEGTLILRPGARDDLPRWPLAVEIVLGPASGAGAGATVRVNDKGAAYATLPAGRWTVRYRLWRATAKGWLVADVGGDAPSAVDVKAGVERDLTLTLDAAAVEAAASLLWGY
jgi:hypothetical protein